MNEQRQKNRTRAPCVVQTKEVLRNTRKIAKKILRFPISTAHVSQMDGSLKVNAARMHFHGSIPDEIIAKLEAGKPEPLQSNRLFQAN
jgi:hypothetical protein